MQRSHHAAAAATNGSRTVTEDTQLIRLTGGPRSRPQVTWDDSVVDNENCGKKKSKICCLYHKPRAYDESSSESDDSDSEEDGGGCEMKKKKKDAGNAYEAQPKSTSSSS